jgi:hemerythrin
MEVVSDRPTLPDGVAAQHGHLAALIKSLRVQLSEGAEWSELARAFDRLNADIAEHFEFEENLMSQRGYPGVAEHRNEHESFRKKVAILRAECDHQQTELLGVLVELLESWFKTHEQTADREVAQFLSAEH